MAMAMVVAGGAATFGVHFSPEISQYTEILAEVGLEGSQLLIGGLMLYGVALLGRYQRIHTTTLLLAPSTTEKSLVALAKGIAELRPKLQEVLSENAQLRMQVETVRQEALEARQRDSTSDSKDALFRLAGSLDTLHAKLDRSMTESSVGLHESIDELASLIEASRDFIQEGIEESEQRAEKHLDNLTSKMRKLSDDLDSGVSNLSEVIEGLSDLSGQLPEDGVESPADEPQGLDILVDLEDDEEEEEDNTSGLGLLDSLDDEPLEELDEEEDEQDAEEEKTTTGEVEVSETSAKPAPMPDLSSAPSLVAREPSEVLGPEPGALLESKPTPLPPALTSGVPAVPTGGAPPLPPGGVPPIKVPPMAIPPIQIPDSSSTPTSRSMALPPMPGSAAPDGQGSPPTAPVFGSGLPLGDLAGEEEPTDGGPSVIRLNDPSPPLPGKSQPVPDSLMPAPEHPDTERSEK